MLTFKHANRRTVPPWEYWAPRMHKSRGYPKRRGGAGEGWNRPGAAGGRTVAGGGAVPVIALRYPALRRWLKRSAWWPATYKGLSLSHHKHLSVRADIPSYPPPRFSARRDQLLFLLLWGWGCAGLRVLLGPPPQPGAPQD